MSSLASFLEHGAFQGYAYAYPHKTAYRPLCPTRALDEVWRDEDKRALFLYAHVPFCEMRCGFCNLFTSANPEQDLVAKYLDAFERQLAVVAAALGADARFARVAIGGGTPTYLKPRELERLCDAIDCHFPHTLGRAHAACEVSPATATPERLATLKRRGFSRISIGVQSFVEAETRELGRPQKSSQAHAALAAIRSHEFPTRNVDLIFGMAGQTIASWRETIFAALQHEPDEIFLYPLYVRPLTGMDRLHRAPTDHRLNLYRTGRDLLFARGYRQVSLRLFRRLDHASSEGPEYCCQEDGMVGLGVGARSYTRALHYCTEYAVGRTGVKAITENYSERSSSDFRHADYGCFLNDSEQRRRYVIKSLLRTDGLDLRRYRDLFHSIATDDFPKICELVDSGLACASEGAVRLNAQGLELSDAIGPWLFSDAMMERMEAYELR